MGGSIRERWTIMFKRRNPRRLVKCRGRGPSGAKRRRRRLPKTVPSQNAVQAIIANLPDYDSEITLRNRLMVELAYGSGLRRGEIVGLDIEDVDLASRTACVTGKGRKRRMVPFTEKAVQLIRRYIEIRHAAHGPLITSTQTHRRIAIRHVSKIFKRLTGYNAHRFRHACATHLLQNGCNLRYIQQLLGHVKLTTTVIYTAVDKTKLAAVVAANHPRSIIA